jgi:formylglycine-generating enzyme
VNRLALAFGLALALPACNLSGQAIGSFDASVDGPPWDVALAEPEPQPGMVWVPPGVLIAGTPPDKLPRIADEEMAGEQVVMHGFYIDIFPYPNEVGAIPTTNISQADARELCENQNKRLCTELELERACKGPENTTYEYGEIYKASICSTGVARALIPNGFNAACRSPFGVHDLHGGVSSWTSSQWGRDVAKPNLVTVRGGNGTVGELVARCANGRGVNKDARREDVGVRCCGGEPNTFEVVLQVTRGEPLRWQAPEDKIAPQLEKLAPEEVQAAVAHMRPEDQPKFKFKVERMWIWRPLGNEELIVGGGCAHPGDKALCGIVIAKMRFDTAALLAWVPTDWWQPTVSEAESPREIFLYGGDRSGAFRKRIAYAWGRIAVADKERKKKRKGQRQATY